MARDFLGNDKKLEALQGPGYMDGFRFGFGQFVAWVLGGLILGGLAFAVAALLKLHA